MSDLLSSNHLSLNKTTPTSYTATLDVTRVGRVAVAIAITILGGSGSGVLVTTERATEPRLFILGRLSTQLDVGGGRVAGESISAANSLRAVLVAAPETLTATVGVAVARRRTETLLTLVVAGQEDLEQDGDQEEETETC